MQKRSSPKRFPPAMVEMLAAAKILGVRSGAEHRFTGVWVVVVDGRAFVRSWNNKSSGWYQAFRKEPFGSIEVQGKTIAVRAVPTRGARLQDAVTSAFGAKYNTKGSQKWVVGFAEPQRARATLELVPA